MPLPRDAPATAAEGRPNLLFILTGDHRWDPMSGAGHYRNYCATLAGLDRKLGRLLAEMTRLGLLETTAIVYAGDNGFSWGEDVLTGKRWATDTNMRVPFIVRLPDGMADAGRRPADLVLNIDLAPAFYVTSLLFK